MAERRGKTSNTPTADERELRHMKVDELREAAKDRGVSGTSKMRKDELVEAVARAERGARGGGEGKRGGGEPERGGGGIRRGPASSDSLKYAQEITSPDDEPERPGRSLVTTNHDVIRRWAEERGGRPATVEGTEHGDHLGVLRFDFGGDDPRLREVSWDEWFKTFDARHLNFVYQEQRRDGRQSNFFQFENPKREDA